MFVLLLKDLAKSGYRSNTARISGGPFLHVAEGNRFSDRKLTKVTSFGERFGALVKAKRGLHGYTQEQLALKIWDEVGRKSQISRIERGKVTNPQASTIDELCAALHITPDEIAACKTKPAPSAGKTGDAPEQVSQGTHFEVVMRNTASRFDRLNYIDESLRQGSLPPDQLNDLRNEKSLIISELGDRGFENEDIDTYADRLARLFGVTHWNEVDEHRAKEAYVELAVACVDFCGSTLRSAQVRLIFAICLNLTVLGRTADRDAVIDKWRDALRANPDLWGRDVIFQHCESASEANILSPEDLDAMTVGEPEGYRALVMARSYRCGSCFYFRFGEFQKARGYLEQSRSYLGLLPPNAPKRLNVETYLDAMACIYDWYAGEIGEEFTSRIDACMRKVELYVPDDVVLLAGLLDLKIQVTAHLETQTEDMRRDFIRPAAKRIDSLLSRSIPSYCILFTDSIRRRAAHYLK